MPQILQVLKSGAGIHSSLGRFFLQLEKGDHTHGALLGCSCNQQREGEHGPSCYISILCHILPAQLFLVSSQREHFDSVGAMPAISDLFFPALNLPKINRTLYGHGTCRLSRGTLIGLASWSKQINKYLVGTHDAQGERCDV